MNSGHLPRVEVSREPGGATVLVHERRDVPLVFLEVQCPGGRMLEPEKLPGMAELSAALLDEGPAGTDPLEWRRKLEGLAAEIAFSSRLDHWSAGFECLSEDLETVAGLFCSAVQRPGLPRGEWNRIVKARRAAAREDWAQPASMIRKVYPVQALGYNHPGAHPAFEKSYARAEYDDASSLAAAAFGSRGELYVLVGGDIASDQAFRLARRVLAALPERKPESPAEPPAAPSAAPVWLVDHPGIDQAYFALTRDGVRSGDPERIALRLANFLIGGGSFSSRLMDRVREAMGHTYGISSGLPERRQAAPFVVQSFTKAGNLGEMLALVDRVLAEIRDKGFTEDEVSLARSSSHGRLPLRLTNPRAILDFEVAGLRAGFPAGQLEVDWRSIPGTTRESVEQAARRIIGDNRFRLAVVGPAKVIGPQLAARGEVAVIPFRSTPDRWPRM